MVTEQGGRSRYSDALDSPQEGSTPEVADRSISRTAFLLAFVRSFNRVYSYVSRRIDDRETCERVVKEVLVENRALLIEKGDDRDTACRLKASSDRLIRRETAARVAAAGS